MSDGVTILKNPKLTSAEDYTLLRSKGLAYIQELGSKLWTDYNEHDPGITILEALCYAITELGYRTAMPMETLLSDKDGNIATGQTLFTPKNILTQAPLNIEDYRKLLVDIPGIHNAWLFTDDFYKVDKKIVPAGEVGIYADCNADSLSYNVTPHPVYIRGLYKVLLDLEDDTQFGDLNNGEIVALSPAAGNFKAGDVSFTVAFATWDEAPVDIAVLLKDDVVHVTTPPVITASGNNWKITIQYTINADATIRTIDGIISVDLQPPGATITTADVTAFFTTAFAQQIFSLYVMKILTARDIVLTAKRALNQNRNLCEDFVSISTVKDEEVAICCDIDVRPGADMEEVQAQVFYAIEEYLDPSIKFYLLQEMLNMGYTVDQVFEGPVLAHGFIDTAQLEKTQLRDEIYTSDIINLVMDIDGVLAVKNFRMTKYDADGNPVPNLTGKAWCMPISLWHKPVFSETRSKIVFYKNQFPYLPSLAEVRDTMKWLRAAGMRNKLTGHADDIALPAGKYAALDTYTSIQNSFPQTYGIGQAGLPSTADDARKAQARQLKAYLLFYDQLLADFFAQLKNAAALFSTNNISQTYNGQFIDTIKNVSEIYKQQGGITLLQDLLQHQQSNTTPVNDWQKLYEDNETFTDRRNRFLDHLMSRFAESFNDYVMLMYSLDYDTQQETQITPATIINNKIDFLKNYPAISYARATAFNYCPQVYSAGDKKYIVDVSRFWSTDNVSGLEKKVSFLSGIKNYTRRFLYCMNQGIIQPTAGSPVKYNYVFANSNGDKITSVTAYDNQSDATDAMEVFINIILSGTGYTVKKTTTGWIINIADEGGTVLAGSNEFSSKAAANNALQLFIAEFNTGCDATGMHLIEHVLLRPRDKTFDLAPVCLDPACDFCGEQDPYSFRISVVLPYWPKHFRSLAFRSYFEDVVRKEAPAHTTVKVCWINNSAMYAFDNAYKAWITALANYGYDGSAANTAALQAANNLLLGLLFTLHSEYPVAALHDCEESKDTNPVMLGKTILGSF